MKMWKKTHSEIWQQKLLHHDNTLSHAPFFTREYFTKNNMAVNPYKPSRLTQRLSFVFPIEDTTILT
jgi:hypothetical protein